MTPGFISITTGLKFIRNKNGRPADFAEDLPGTHSIMRPNHLPAWKCTACELVLMRYGHNIHREVERMATAMEQPEEHELRLDDPEEDEVLARERRDPGR